MTNLIRRLSGIGALALYWLIALGFLFYASPISWDASGPTATFRWGQAPSPTQAEWNASPALRQQFYAPYLIAACFVTLVGVGLATFLARRWELGRRRLFLATFGCTLFALLLSAATSDLGTVLRVWNGPGFFYLRTPSGPLFFYQDAIFYCLRCLVPVSALAGVFALALARTRRNL